MNHVEVDYSNRYPFRNPILEVLDSFLTCNSDLFQNALTRASDQCIIANVLQKLASCPYNVHHVHTNGEVGGIFDPGQILRQGTLSTWPALICDENLGSDLLRGRRSVGRA